MIFAGSASPRLTAAICRELGVKVGASEVVRFSEGTLFVRVLENVRGRSVYLVQSTVFPTNANFMELLFWIAAFSRASADSVTVIVPYFSYAKGDKKDEPRVSIRARVCADAIEAAGADRVVTLDLHAPQIQGFFRVPVDDLYAMPYLCARLGHLRLEEAKSPAQTGAAGLISSVLFPIATSAQHPMTRRTNLPLCGGAFPSRLTWHVVSLYRTGGVNPSVDYREEPESGERGYAQSGPATGAPGLMNSWSGCLGS